MARGKDCPAGSPECREGARPPRGLHAQSRCWTRSWTENFKQIKSTLHSAEQYGGQGEGLGVGSE